MGHPNPVATPFFERKKMESDRPVDRPSEGYFAQTGCEELVENLAPVQVGGGDVFHFAGFLR